MLIEGSLRAGKTSFLAKTFVALLSQGVCASDILVICQNSHRKEKFVAKALELLNESEISAIDEIPAFTFNGVVYNFISNNWPLVEKELKSAGFPVIMPNLCGMEATEYFLSSCVDRVNADPIFNFNDFRSGMNLKHQLLRRYRLISENCLSPAEVMEAAAYTNDVFSQSAKKTLDLLKVKTTSARAFDYLKQMNTFLYLLNTSQVKDYANIQYLLVDDYEELNTAAQFFIQWLMPQVKDFYITGDSDGGARRGYLCANPKGWQQLKLTYASLVRNLDAVSDLTSDAEKVFNAVNNNSPENFSNIEIPPSALTWLEMVKDLAKLIDDFVEKKGIALNDIVIVTPHPDESLCYSLEDELQGKYSFKVMAGARKYQEDIYSQGLIILLQLINPQWKVRPSSYEIRAILTRLMDIPLTDCAQVLDFYKANGTLPEIVGFSSEIYSRRYDSLIETVKKLSSQELVFEEKFQAIVSDFLPVFLKENADLSCINSLLHSYMEFKTIFENTAELEGKSLEKEWLIHSRNTVVTDNTDYLTGRPDDEILIATPQMTVDAEIYSKIQIWFDSSAYAWAKSDVGPLYNSWVLRKDWSGDTYSTEIHKKLTEEKTAYLMRKLVLCASEKIICFSSQLDRAGVENSGGLLGYFQQDEIVKINSNFIPREDQKPVLEYTGGNMAVAAVPGAGKTAVIQELIIRLINAGTKPSEILVLTYMESAARNVTRRIKDAAPELKELPVVSTIHGLAHSIIRDDKNASLIGLSSDFEICDDYLRTQMLEEICFSILPAGEDNFKNYMKTMMSAVSRAKYNGMTGDIAARYLRENPDGNLAEFLSIYTEYSNRLKSMNMVDFDDLLCLSCYLLESYPDIRRYYASKFKYVIEDEAQDSSSVQQKLIKMLCEANKNLVRCGDTNQAITTTFSNADVQGFRMFIAKASKKVEMICSQRCAAQIYTAANKLIKWSQCIPVLQNSFYPLMMKAVTGRNPVAKNPLYFNVYENFEEEKDYIISRIKDIRKSNPEYKIALLVRSNPRVVQWAETLEENGVPYICFSEKLGQKKVFRFVQKFFDFLCHPWDNRSVKNLYMEFVSNGFAKKNFESLNFLDNLGSSFVTFSYKDLPTQNLAEFLADLRYWMSITDISYPALVVRIGNHYFKNLIDRSNVQLMSILVSRQLAFIAKEENLIAEPLPYLAEYLRVLSEKSRINSVKFFEEESVESDYVYLMTVHKSKGLEFDAVFMPEMYESEYSYCVNPELIRNVQEKFLFTAIDRLCGVRTRKTEDMCRIEQAEEHMRLIYVGMTRAKRLLSMTSNSKKTNFYGKEETNIPSVVLEYFADASKPVAEVADE